MVMVKLSMWRVMVMVRLSMWMMMMMVRMRRVMVIERLRLGIRRSRVSTAAAKNQALTVFTSQNGNSQRSSLISQSKWQIGEKSDDLTSGMSFAASQFSCSVSHLWNIFTLSIFVSLSLDNYLFVVCQSFDIFLCCSVVCLSVVIFLCLVVCWYLSLFDCLLISFLAACLMFSIHLHWEALVAINDASQDEHVSPNLGSTSREALRVCQHQCQYQQHQHHPNPRRLKPTTAEAASSLGAAIREWVDQAPVLMLYAMQSSLAIMM